MGKSCASTHIYEAQWQNHFDGRVCAAAALSSLY